MYNKVQLLYKLRGIAKGFKDVCNIDIELMDAVGKSYLYSQERLNV